MFDLNYRTINKYNGMGGELIKYTRCGLVIKNGKKSKIEKFKVWKKSKNN